MIKVLKFGGSSVADATRISAVMDIVCPASEGSKVVLVLSAISGCTDALLECSHLEGRSLSDALKRLEDRHIRIARRLFTGEDFIDAERSIRQIFTSIEAAPPQIRVTYGEILSTTLVERKLRCEGYKTHWCDSRTLVRTASGKLDEGLTYALISKEIASYPEAGIYVAPGFIASDENGVPTTLGRGGSDYSAAIYAAALKADSLQIWTDVSGMMTANPKTVPAARTIDRISYEAALELARCGAKVLYAPTVMPAMKAGIEIDILNTFAPKAPGTVVCACPSRMQRSRWMGVTSLQCSGEDASCCELTLVGEGVKERSNPSRRLLTCLQDAGLKPLGEVYGSESVFKVRLRSNVESEALLAVHREFFEERKETLINVFLAGYGAVGKALVDILASSGERILARTGCSIRIVGVSDSRHFIIDMQGLDAASIASRLQGGESAAEDGFIKAVCDVAPRGAVFVDATDSCTLYKSYPQLFRRRVSIVTSNRRSLASDYSDYAALKSEAMQNGVRFRYDTTVGNALPLLESISSGANCSDELLSIEAVVSCTLNYIITNYDGVRAKSFASLLKKAQDEGLTEKDPRVDLAGGDVLRKLLILSREALVPLEESDVKVTPALPEEFFNCPLQDFYRLLDDYESEFVRLEDELDSIGKRRRFVASLIADPQAPKGYRAEIKMQLVGSDSPFYWLSGTENVVVVRSRYSSAPMVIKGAGEGDKLAASGIIRDILL